MKNQLSASLLLTLCLTLPATAQIKKWVDKDGKVHYGDATSAPTKSEDIKINDIRNGFDTTSKLPRVEPKANQSKKESESKDGKFGLSAESIQKCIEYGKEMSTKPNMYRTDLGESQSQLILAQSIKKTCPGLQVRCSVSSNKPDQKQCSVHKGEGDDVVFKGKYDETYTQFKTQ